MGASINGPGTKGRMWQEKLARDLRTLGFPDAESTYGPCGDIKGVPLVVEAKNEARVTLGEYINQLHKEMKRAGVDTGLVWIKRRGFDNTDDAYVLTTGRIAKRFISELYLE
jgi:hypothetical protein